MAKPQLQPGAIIDGFAVGECVHRGGMATLWSVTRPEIASPLLMKVPRVSEGEDPAAIVSFEMEQMILPRLSGPHVPACYATGDFSSQAYVVMELIPGKTLYSRLGDLPLPYEEARFMSWKIAIALADLHRQSVIHHDIKPSSIMFRPSGDAVLIDFGLSHHNHLPDLLQEEFRVPYGTAPYMAPERLLGVRDDPRSDLFSLGVLLYFFTTGVRPFGESETMSGMRRRLWRDPYPPRQLKADYPPWLQEIVLRCLEIEPVWRYPTASQLAFELAHPDQVKLTARAEKLKRDPLATVWRRRFNGNPVQSPRRAAVAAQLASGPIVAVALDVSEGSAELNEALRRTVERILSTLPAARLACLNVLKLGRVTIDRTLDEEGNNKHVGRLVTLKHWASPLKLDESRLTAHVLEAIDPASAILEFVETNHVDHVVIGARQNSFARRLLGSTSARVAAEASCTVTVVRPPRLAGQAGGDDEPGDAEDDRSILAAKAE
jgi:serine/threonine protein kinase